MFIVVSFYKNMSLKDLLLLKKKKKKWAKIVEKIPKRAFFFGSAQTIAQIKTPEVY